MDYYVYIHKQKDTGQVFYVGKGRGRRAWSAYSRSKFWKSKVEKHGIVVELVLDNIQEWYALELEQELILKYGRLDLNTGTLVNFTDGGDGASGFKQPDHSKMLSSQRMVGLKNVKADLRLYRFENVHTLEVFEGTRYALEQSIGKSVNDLFKTNSYSINGWTVEGKINPNPAQDLNHYLFQHKNGEVFMGTRVSFKNKFGHSIKPLFTTKPSKYCKGWKVVEVLYRRVYINT